MARFESMLFVPTYLTDFSIKACKMIQSIANILRLSEIVARACIYRRRTQFTKGRKRYECGGCVSLRRLQTKGNTELHAYRFFGSATGIPFTFYLF